ncbi:MAG: hypothetical protein J2P53_01165 [Bradyrhizobiaceae bacterium]|nr:hypothetical protein [Bradyrhizobiaceae bacterium]
MLPTTILIDEAPRCVVRPNDMKDLKRFLRNAKGFLLAERPEGKITHRNANEDESHKYRTALALHKACGGDDENFFGTPLYGADAAAAMSAAPRPAEAAVSSK